MNFPSKLIEEAVEQFAKLPGVGRKTALRLALNLLQMDKEEVNMRATIPIFSSQMSGITVAYQLKSLEHLGEVLDTTSANSEMQSLIEEANKFASLEAASVMVAF